MLTARRYNLNDPVRCASTAFVVKLAAVTDYADICLSSAGVKGVRHHHLVHIFIFYAA